MRGEGRWSALVEVCKWQVSWDTVILIQELAENEGGNFCTSILVLVHDYLLAHDKHLFGLWESGVEIVPVKGILSWLCNLLCFHWYVMNSSKLCVCISLYACMQTNNTMWRWMVLCTWLEAILFLACQDFAFLLYLSFFIPQETCHPIMCSYKVVKVFFEVWGLQGRVESGVHNVS